MANRYLEGWTIATAAAVGFVLTLVLSSYLTGTLESLVFDIGTVPALLLFGYLWLLSLVGAGDVKIDQLRMQDAGWMAALGALAAVFFLTAVFVVGFVEPIGPLDPATLPVFSVVAVGIAVGAIVGGLLWLWFSICLHTARRIVEID